MSVAPALSRPVRVIGRARAQPGTRDLPEEAAVAITCNAETQAVMMATPADLEDFAVGFALSEGIAAIGEIEDVEIAPQDQGIEARLWLAPAAAARLGARRRAMAGPVGCGLCGIDSIEAALRPLPAVPGAPAVTPGHLGAALAALGTRQPLHDRTRAVHAAGLFRPGAGLVAAREDVGRHNALDKLIGALARSGSDAAGGVVVLTSRVSVEMVQKAAMAGAPVILAVSAPTAHAARLAEGAGIAIIRETGAGWEIHCHPERIEEGQSSDVA